MCRGLRIVNCCREGDDDLALASVPHLRARIFNSLDHCARLVRSQSTTARVSSSVRVLAIGALKKICLIAFPNRHRTDRSFVGHSLARMI